MFRGTLFILVLFIPTVGKASNFELATDVTLPFRLNVEGQSNSGRENWKYGAEVRYSFASEAEVGGRIEFDLDRHQGAYRKYGFTPFLTSHWMRHETWHPYARFELPFIWKGAPNNLGDDSKIDLGLGGGVGIAWKVQNIPLSIYYDFGFHYFFGINSALSVLSIDLFRIGFAYRL